MTPTMIGTPPIGYRFLLAHEADRMDYAHPIVLWTKDGELCHGTIIRHTDEAIRVMLRSGAEIDMDLDCPDYWPEGEVRDRRPPMSPDGEFVAVKAIPATDDDEIEPLMRTSVALAKAAKDDPELAAAVAEVRRILMKRLKKEAA